METSDNLVEESNNALPIRGDSPESLARLLDVSIGTVHRWVREGKLKATRQNGRLFIPIESNSEFVVAKFRTRRHVEPKAWMPKELEDYAEWHEILDELVWLLKICYSSRQDIQRGRFRLDQIFKNYLQFHHVSLDKVARVFDSEIKGKAGLVTNDLKRGWYNELSYLFPIKESTLGLSFKDISANRDSSNSRFTFPSWRIVSAYYSVYFYLRSVTLQKQRAFRIQEHGATISVFKSNLLQPLERTIWKFPLNISYIPLKTINQTDRPHNSLKHTNFKYCLHPRSPHRTPNQIFEHIYRSFRRKSKRTAKPSMYTLFDYLHDFRVWANYLDIDNLLSLWGSGYKTFIDQNLSVLLFFIGGISEICYMANYGGNRYFKQLQNFYDLFTTNSDLLKAEFLKTSLYQRLQIYRHLGWITENIDLHQEKAPHEVQFPLEH